MLSAALSASSVSPGRPSAVQTHKHNVSEKFLPVSLRGIVPSTDRGGQRLSVALGLQVSLETPQERNAVTALSLQRPVAVKPLHELTLPLHRQVTSDLT